MAKQKNTTCGYCKRWVDYKMVHGTELLGFCPHNSSTTTIVYTAEDGTCDDFLSRRGRPLGFSMTDKTKSKISVGMTGKTHDEETKKKIADTLTGRNHTEEAKRNMRLAQSKRKLTNLCKDNEA